MTLVHCHLLSLSCDDNEKPGDDFVLNCDGCEIRLENADILSNLESKVSHLEPSQQCMNPEPDSNHVFNGGGCYVDNLCAECTVDIVKPIRCSGCTICDAEFQVRLKQCNIVPAKPYHCNLCGVEFQLN